MAQSTPITRTSPNGSPTDHQPANVPSHLSNSGAADLIEMLDALSPTRREIALATIYTLYRGQIDALAVH